MQSLESLSLDHLSRILGRYLKDLHSTIKVLPPAIKDKLLYKLCHASLNAWDYANLKQVLEVLVHSKTRRIDLFIAVDEDILNILKLSNDLRYLCLSSGCHSSISSTSLLNLTPYLKLLRVLELPSCDAVNDVFLVSIARNCPLLIGLDVGGCFNITDSALEALSVMENLQWLKFSNTKITTKGVETLIAGASGHSLKELCLANCKFVTSAVLNMIAEYCPNIEILIFYNTPINMDIYSLYETNESCFKKLKQLAWTVQ